MISLRIARQRSAVAIATTLSAAALSLRCSVATPACRDCDHDDLPPRRTRNYWGKPARKCDPFGAKQESRRAGRRCDESGGGAAAAPKDVTHPKTFVIEPPGRGPSTFMQREAESNGGRADARTLSLAPPY